MRTAWKSSSRPLGARPIQCWVWMSRTRTSSMSWPLSSQTSRCRASSGDSPGSIPPPGSVQRPAAFVDADSWVSRTPLVCDQGVGRRALVGVDVLPLVALESRVGGHDEVREGLVVRGGRPHGIPQRQHVLRARDRVDPPDALGDPAELASTRTGSAPWPSGNAATCSPAPMTVSVVLTTTYCSVRHDADLGARPVTRRPSCPVDFEEAALRKPAFMAAARGR